VALGDERIVQGDVRGILSPEHGGACADWESRPASDPDTTVRVAIVGALPETAG